MSSAERYDVFHRTWWTANPARPGVREPGAGERHYLARDVSLSVARAMCRDWNARHAFHFRHDKARVPQFVA